MSRLFPLEGSKLGRYEIRRQLGSGGMGVVYEARDPERDRLVAIKTLPELDPSALYRFKREFRALADVTHPNLVSLYELVSVDNRWFFTMELVDGVDFLTWVRGPKRSNPLPPIERLARIRRGLRQLVHGLMAIHEVGKVHRDIKPTNILVTPKARVVLLDFGLVGDRPELDHDSESQVVGTAVYMAPEQAHSRRVGPAADWYSVGVVLYEALTARAPFAGAPLKVLMEKQKAEPVPPRSFSPEVPDELNDLCCELLRRTPAARPGGEQILERLVEGHDEHREKLTTDTFGQAPPFVGREDELAALRSDFERVGDGPVITVLRGETGVGRSALVRRFAGDIVARPIDEREVTVLYGRCYERESVPYKAFDGVIDALSERLKRMDRHEAAAFLPDDAALLTRLFPVLGRVPAVARLSAADGDVERHHQLRGRAFEALRELLARLAATRAIVIIVDDFQWADQDSLALLGEVLRPPAAPAIHFVAAVRTAEAGEDLPPAIAAALSELRGVADRELGPMREDDAAQLVEKVMRRFGADPGDEAAAIARAARCHPLFLDELARHVAAGRSRSPDATLLDDALWARIEPLDAPARRLLEIVAIAGLPLATTIAARAAGLDESECNRFLAMLRLANLVRPTREHGRDAVEPYHDRVRDVVLRHVDDGARTEHHAAVADALEGAGAAADDPQILIRHLVMAGDDARAAAAAREAARRAAQALAFERAADMFRVALQLGTHGDIDTINIQRQLAEALANAGRGPEAADVYRTVAEHADAATRLECRRHAAEQLLLSGHIERGLDALGDVLAQIGGRIPPTPRRALISLLFKRAVLAVRGRRFRARDETEIAPRDLLELDVYHAVATTVSPVDTIRGAEFHARALQLALKLGEPSRVVRSICMEAMLVATSGRIQRSEALIRRAAEVARGRNDSGLDAFLVASRAMTMYFAGRYAEAVGLFERTEMFYERAAGVFELNIARVFRLLSLRMMGRCRELERDYERFMRDARRRGDRYLETTLTRAINMVFLVNDDPRGARQALASTGWTPPKSGYHVQHWYKTRARGEVHLYLGDLRGSLEQIGPSIRRLEKSLLLRVQIIRLEYGWLVARLALGEIDCGAEPGPMLRRAEACVKKLEGEGTRVGELYAHFVRASIAWRRDSPETALTELAAAQRTAEESDLHLYAAAARRRRGELRNGAAAAADIDAADAWMRVEEIRNPERMTNMILPGFASSRADS